MRSVAGLPGPARASMQRRKEQWSILLQIAAEESEAAKQERIPNRPRRRMVWEERLQSLSEQECKRTYRMDLETFNWILGKIRHHPRVTREAKKARGPIAAELRLSMTLRYLAGCMLPPQVTRLVIPCLQAGRTLTSTRCMVWGSKHSMTLCGMYALPSLSACQSHSSGRIRIRMRS